ncbi:hypothetical protein SAMN02745146_0096 [Hymenobacter daecheongensis DSM 21074]|uniref:Uncharacterized protein n=1 Tax=Hymenobacter daecheongensis DSM 21074 TaxID=1121955 RepID=A0A1M6LY02_9BACT|nr:hypothetical protein [Hymenobacter daecheongensis]SHJ76035.1 hypothetical protein SAMN02745146_0096 [Hymenobacter daecheongensis DSM 21074]
MIKTNKPQEYTPEQIEAFEARSENKSRGKVSLFRFPSDDNPDKPAQFWCAKPNRQQIAAIAETSETDSAKGNDLFINTCVLAGDLDQLEHDDALYFGLLKEISGLIENKKKL